jgi:hypothetical protein
MSRDIEINVNGRLRDVVFAVQLDDALMKVESAK